MTQIIEDRDKLDAMIERQEVVAGLKLRPFSAESLILLQLMDNPFITQKPVLNNEIFYHISSFLYILAGNPDEVRNATADKKLFRESVLKFASGLKISDIIQSAEQIKEICAKAMVGLNFSVDDSPGPN